MHIVPFKIIKPVGDVAPHEVYGHSAVIDGHKMYVFGGCDKAGKFNNDLFVYNFGKYYNGLLICCTLIARKVTRLSFRRKAPTWHIDSAVLSRDTDLIWQKNSSGR